ncbi:MAG: hypothetical protein IPN26_12290 [Bacteroidetes bacterium]|nr:hypothetical protein [Bacteroidota bacterium]
MEDVLKLNVLQNDVERMQAREGEIEDIDEYYNQQIHSLQDVVTGTFGNQKEKIPKTFDATEYIRIR